MWGWVQVLVASVPLLPRLTAWIRNPDHVPQGDNQVQFSLVVILCKLGGTSITIIMFQMAVLSFILGFISSILQRLAMLSISSRFIYCPVLCLSLCVSIEASTHLSCPVVKGD